MDKRLSHFNVTVKITCHFIVMVNNVNYFSLKVKIVSHFNVIFNKV